MEIGFSKLLYKNMRIYSSIYYILFPNFQKINKYIYNSNLEVEIGVEIGKIPNFHFPLNKTVKMI